MISIGGTAPAPPYGMEPELELGNLLSGSSDGIVCMDESLRIVLFNQAAANMLGIDAESAIGKTFETCLDPANADAFRKALDRLAGTTEATLDFLRPLRLVQRLPSGSLTTIEANLTQTITMNGRLFTVFLRDVSDEIDAARTMDSLEEDLEAQLAEVRQRSDKLALLKAHADFLQSCLTYGEACIEIERFGRKLFPAGGVLARTTLGSRTLLVSADWCGLPLSQTFDVDTCWSLRRDMPTIEPDHQPCLHLPGGREWLCIPLTARGDTLGVLSLVKDDDLDYEIAQAFADTIRLRFGNIERVNRIRDLTALDQSSGSLTRLALHEFGAKQLERCRNGSLPIGVLALLCTDPSAVIDSKQVIALLAADAMPDEAIGTYEDGVLVIVLPGNSSVLLEQRAERVRRTLGGLLHAEIVTGTAEAVPGQSFAELCLLAVQSLGR